MMGTPIKFGAKDAAAASGRKRYPVRPAPATAGTGRAASTTPIPWRSHIVFANAFRTDAIGVLKDDHRMVEELFERFEESDSESRRLELAQEVCQALTLHAHVEEQLFYPALRRAGMDADLLDEAEVEHGTVKAMIEDIDGARADAALFRARMRVLGEYVRHHVQEEENEIMPGARSLGIDLDALGEEILAAKVRLEARVAELAPDPVAAGRVHVLKVDGRGLRHR
jgi:hemerythrin superfamily protein